MTWQILALLLFAIPCQARQLSDLRTDTRLLANDASSSARQRFSNASIDAWLNEAQRVADVRTFCVYNATSFDLVAGTTYYSLPNSFLAIRRVLRDSQQLDEMSPAALDGRSTEWETSCGLPSYYFINFSTRTKIGFSPFPNTSSDTGTIKVEYFSYSADMSADTDVPFSGIREFYAYHHMLPYYAASRMSLIDGKSDKAAFYQQYFELIVGTMKERCIERPNYFPGATGRRQ